jgi:hypothetical protein
MPVELSLGVVAVVGEVSVDANFSVIVAGCSPVDVSEGICVVVVGLSSLSVVAAVPAVNISAAVNVDVSGISVVSFTSGVTGPDLGRSGRKGGVVVVSRSGISVLFGELLLRSGYNIITGSVTLTLIPVAGSTVVSSATTPIFSVSVVSLVFVASVVFSVVKRELVVITVVRRVGSFVEMVDCRLLGLNLFETRPKTAFGEAVDLPP